MDAIQTLKQFIADRRAGSALRLAREIGCSYEIVRLWLARERRPGRTSRRKLAALMTEDGFLSQSDSQSFFSALMTDDLQNGNASASDVNNLLCNVKGSVQPFFSGADRP